MENQVTNLFAYFEQREEEERKKEQEAQEKASKCDWKEFFDMQLEDVSTFSFPVKIKSDNYVSLSQEELAMINDCYENEATYLEQDFARRDSDDGIADMEGKELRRAYFKEYKGTHIFKFREQYLDSYLALKGLDECMKTNFATLFIESVMFYGLEGFEVSKHNIIQAAMAGVKYHIDRELEEKRKYLNRNERRRMNNEMCKSSLEDLLCTDRDVSNEAKKILLGMKGAKEDD